MLDLDFIRARFPALESPWALFDNAGGSVPEHSVIARVADYMTRLGVQHGASYALSQEAVTRCTEGRASAARLLGANPAEVVLGPSSTVLAARLAAALRPAWAPGDEVIVTDLDHEANVGPWARLAATGIVVKEWGLRPDTQRLEAADLEPLLTPRTRLVAFTHCSNIVGSIHDVPTITARVRAAGALSCVDGVAYAPHRRVDVAALGCDFYLVSLYKVFGPHLAALYGREQALREARGQNHFFIGEDEVPYKFEPGGAPHELVAGLPGITEYLEALDAHHVGEGAAAGDALTGAFDHIAVQESTLLEPLLEYLRARPEVRLLGEPTADPERRVGTVAFTVDGRHAQEFPSALDRDRVAIRWGHFYAHRAVSRLGLHERGGVVRASLLHYNTPDEVTRLIDGLDAALSIPTHQSIV